MTSEIPLVDVSAAFASAPDRRMAGTALVAALENTGFAYVVGHGVPQATIDAAFRASKAFHALPLVSKMAIHQNAFHRGYMPFSSSTIVTSTVAQVRKPNQSESFMMMHELAPDDPDRGKPLQGPNQWPAELPEFKPTVLAYNAALGAVGNRLVECIASGLGLAPDHFAGHFRKPTTFVRMLHYPPRPADAPDDLYGSAPHTDYGFLTLVCQDDTGGLEVKRRDGGWISATPVPGAFVMNAADILMRWTNNRLVSTPHRVVNRSPRDRYSIAYFHDPAMDAVVAPLPGAAAQWPPVRYGDYLMERLDKNYAYRAKAAG
ncbi:MAG: isopenicillin N synthase family oxygenase [Alphaproteobacteria bacterium]|nr:isopenicillin N synthase family oxygenase [Alphaproteobacteria bacterium]